MPSRHLISPCLLLSAVTLMLGCGETPTGADTEALYSTSASAAAPSRPMKGSCTTTFVLIPLEFGPGGVLLSASTPFEGTCQISHLGRVRVSAEQVVRFFPDGSSRADATITYTAANGDELYLHSAVAEFAPPSSEGIASGSMVQEVTGGTGRFAGATGTTTGQLDVDLVGASGSYQFAGEIAY